MDSNAEYETLLLMIAWCLMGLLLPLIVIAVLVN